MQVGDLVKYRNPTTNDVNRVFLILEIYEHHADHRKMPAANLWVKLEDHKFHTPCADLEIVSASR